MFASTYNALYKINPDNHAIALVGTFAGCSNIHDLAMDGSGQLFASSYQGMHKIDKSSATCSTFAWSQKPNNLAVFPKGAIDQQTDVLVGFNNHNYLAFSKSNSEEKYLGQFSGPGNSTPWGDLVWVPGMGSVVSAYGGVGGCNPACLVQFDPKSGTMIKNYGSPGLQGLMGLAHFNGVTYGFAYQGKVYELIFGANNVTAKEVVMNNPPPQLQWTGAAATLSAL